MVARKEEEESWLLSFSVSQEEIVTDGEEQAMKAASS